MVVHRAKLISAEDLYRLNTVSGCRIAPDGNSVAYTIQRVDRPSEKKYSNYAVGWTDI
jgi:hypothetical protein